MSPDKSTSTDSSSSINWSTVIPWIIAIIGISLSAFQYIQSQESRDPQLVTDPSRTQIISVDRLSEAPIQVVKQDGTRITDDVTAVNFYLWNSGDIPIKREEILRSITITIDDRDAEILDYKLRTYSREVIEPNLRIDSADAPALTADFALLEQNDGMAGQIIYQGDPDADIEYGGVIQGVGSLENEPTYPLQYKTSQYLDYITQSEEDEAGLGLASLLIGMGMPLFFLLMIAVGYITARFENDSDEDGEDTEERQTDESAEEDDESSDTINIPTRAAVTLFILILLGIVIVGGIVVPWKASAEYRDANVMSMVPQSLRRTPGS